MPRIQHKRGTSANLASVNPTPLAGELVWDSTENAIKIGDGATAWTSLAYVTATPRTHTHSADAITSGTIDYARLPVGSTSSTVCAGDDSRLTDARTPTAHKATHATGGSDALTPGDIGAAPAASPTFTGVITVAAGSAAAPALVFSGDSNTGIAQIGGADTWSVVTGNAERLRVRADGNIGIGSSGASNIIVTVAGLSSGYGAFINPTFSGAENFATRFQAATPASSTTSAITMVDVYGPVLGSGATLATSRGLHVKSTVAVAANNFGVQLSIGSGAGRWNIYADGTAQNWFAGNVGIGSGKTAPATALDVNGVITVSATSGSAGSYAPSLTFSGDANAGFGQVSGESDTASVFTAGHERVRVKSTGAVRFVPLSADPATGEAGDVYYNSSTNKLRVYNGTSWIDLH